MTGSPAASRHLQVVGKPGAESLGSAMSGTWRVGVITVSDSRARGPGGDDRSGDLIAERLATLPARLTLRRVVADEVTEIQSALRDALKQAELVVLTGGTGVGPRDVTPQAVLPLLDYELPGMAEAMRQEGRRSTAHAMLSRQLAGVSRGRLIIVLPGSPRAVAEGLEVIWEALPHALALLSGDTLHP